MVLGFNWFSIFPGHLLTAEQLAWYAKPRLRNFRFFGIGIGWLFIGVMVGTKEKK